MEQAEPHRDWLGELAGKYRLVRALGSGGSGVVYEGCHESIGNRAAIKVLRCGAGQGPTAVVRLYNEARAANLARHPGLVEISDFGQMADGTPYILMEYLEGETLRARLLRAGALGEAQTLRLARQVADALAALHRAGVLHRDLKPENVFLVPDPEAPSGERAKIVDFGLARPCAGADVPLLQTQGLTLVGTPAYMSPEQCRRDQAVGDRSDVYALGVVLYEGLTGRPPFQARDAVEILYQHLQVAPRPLRRAVVASAGLCALIHQMLHKEPAARPSAEAVLLRLAGLQAQATRRRPSVMPAAFTVLLLALGLGAWGIPALRRSALPAQATRPAQAAQVAQLLGPAVRQIPQRGPERTRLAVNAPEARIPGPAQDETRGSAAPALSTRERTAARLRVRRDSRQAPEEPRLPPPTPPTEESPKEPVYEPPIQDLEAPR